MNRKHPSSTQLLRFGAFTADLRAGELYRDGRKVKLQERPFQVLAQLLVRPGEVVSKQELVEKLWPADTFADVSHILKTCISKIRDALGDSAESPHFIETVSPWGYRFLAKVEHAGTVLPSRVHPGRGRVRLAVLPFEMLSSTGREDPIAAGLMQETITQLCRLRPPRLLGVIARTSVMKYKRGDASVTQVGRELRIDYVVKARVRRRGGRVRIMAQLIRIDDQAVMWARSYERDSDEVFGLQREIGEKIALEVQEILFPATGPDKGGDVHGAAEPPYPPKSAE